MLHYTSCRVKNAQQRHLPLEVLVATVKAEADGMYKYTQFHVYLYREEIIPCVSSCVDDASAIEKVKTTQ
jgi:hypothetical protein